MVPGMELQRIVATIRFVSDEPQIKRAIFY